MCNKCNNCSKETTNPKFCSRSCAAQVTGRTHPKRITKKKCVVCGEKAKSYRHLRCEKHHQEYLESKPEQLRKRTLKFYFDKISLKNLHSSSKSAHIRGLARSQHKELLQKSCYNCKYDKHVELCHIKPIHKFPETATLEEVNSFNNVIQLCPNCHWELDSGLLHLEFPEQSESQ